MTIIDQAVAGLSTVRDDIECTRLRWMDGRPDADAATLEIETISRRLVALSDALEARRQIGLPFLIEAIVHRMSNGIDEEILSAIRLCLGQIVRHPASLDAVIVNLERALDADVDREQNRKGRVLLTRLEKERQERLPAPPHPELLAEAFTTTVFKAQREKPGIEGTSGGWETISTEITPERAFGIVRTFSEFTTGKADAPAYRVIERMAVSHPMGDDDVQEVDDASYDVEGLYGNVFGENRTWQRWQKADTLADARRMTTALGKIINPRTRDRTSPTAVRLRRVMKTIRVLDAAA